MTLLCLFFAVECLLNLKAFPPIHEKTSAVWYRIFKSVQDYPDSLDVVFYGTSRTQLAVSPSAFSEKMKDLDRKTRCWNLGILAIFDAGIKAHVENVKKADIVVIEQFALQFSTPFVAYDRFEKIKNETWRFYIEDMAKQRLGKSFMIIRINIFPSLFYKSFHKFETHGNGWTEVVFTENQDVIDTLKKNEFDANTASLDQIPIEKARAAQKRYLALFDKIKKNGALLVILRMPVGGKLREREDELLAAGYHTDFLMEDDDILYIDANIHEKLSKYRPVEYSHLNSVDAVNFSRDLAEVVDGWLTNKHL
jgi:hypothetical protein